jgi:transposase InsO family protein
LSACEGIEKVGFDQELTFNPPHADMHKNARTTPLSRAMIVQRVERDGLSCRAVATALQLSEKTVRKWLGRYRREGTGGLIDRTSRPHGVIPVQQRPRWCLVERLRRQRCSYTEISLRTGLSRATLSRWLRQRGLNRLPKLGVTAPVVRYEHKHPGDLLHLDTKKLGRIARVGHRINADRRSRVRGIGWEYLHVCVDDHSRVGTAEMYPDEHGVTAAAFLERAVAYYASFGVRVRRVMTDNGACYLSKAFQAACARLQLRHLRTRPYTPRTNGKAERFIQSALREWAYAHAYRRSQERSATLPLWLHRYNWHRPHHSLGLNPPISRLALSADNLVRLHS